MRCIRLLLSILGLLALLVAAPAGETEYHAISDPLPGLAGKTYGDLLRQVIPDLKLGEQSATGTQTAPLRHVAGAGWGGEALDPVEVTGVSSLELRAADKPYRLLLADLGTSQDRMESTTALALFDAEGSLLDAVDVGFDRWTGFAEPTTLPIGGTNEAAIIVSEHANSNQTYTTHAVIYIENGKLRLADTVFTFNEANCSYERRQTPHFQPLAAGAENAGFVVAVTDRQQPPEEPCADQPAAEAFEREVRVTYRWDEAAKAFVPDSDALSRMEAESEQRF